jgi:predicted outer membrane repeat protein
MIQTDVYVPGGQGLDIGPGVTVFFTGAYAFYVDNRAFFNVAGAEGDSVRFTADTLANPQGWRGIHIGLTTDTCRIFYAIVEYARTDTSYDPGHGIEVSSAPFQLRHSTVRSCSGNEGGAVQISVSGFDPVHYAEVTACHFYNNTGIYGGALQIADRPALITDCIFENNSSQGGGAIDVYGEDTLRFVNCIIRNNSEIGNNYGGGGMMIEAGWVELTGCSITGNSASHAAGIKVFVPLSLRMTDCTISDNVATSGFGGGMEDFGYDAILERCLFDRNTALFGGAVAITNGENPVLRNCTFTRNVAVTHGGAIYSTAGSPLVYSSIFAFTHGDAACYIGQANYHFHNSLFFDNSSGSFFFITPPPDTVRLGRVNRINVNLDSCDAYFNLYLDPLFADTATGNFHLTANSPCIDAGDSQSPRDPDSTIADIGAFYYDQRLKSDRTFNPQPSSFSLSSFPNPFNPVTRLRYDLPQAGAVSLKVYDILGRETAQLVDKHMLSGSYSVSWNAESLPSGMYFAVLQSGNIHLVQKLLLLK